MISSDVRVEPLVGGLVLLITATYFAATNITGIALIILVVVAAAFSVQILVSVFSVTRERHRLDAAVVESQRRTGRALAWSIVLIAFSSLALAFSAWLVVGRDHLAALVGVLLSITFVIVAAQTIRAVASLRTIPVHATE